MALLSAITARPLSPPVFALYRNGCREHLAAPQNVSFVQPSGLEASSRDCATRVTRREREFAAQTAQAMAEDRPWKFEIPTMDEILESPRWPEKVCDGFALALCALFANSMAQHVEGLCSSFTGCQSAELIDSELSAPGQELDDLLELVPQLGARLGELGPTGTG